jgi:hypothetical protein
VLVKWKPLTAIVIVRTGDGMKANWKTNAA